MNLLGSKFWVGMVVGSVVGAVAYRCSRTEKAKRLKAELCNMLHEMGGKAAEKGAKVADVIADKAEQAKEKAHSFARDYGA